jgi:hypothetical protein
LVGWWPQLKVPVEPLRDLNTIVNPQLNRVYRGAFFTGEGPWKQELHDFVHNRHLFPRHGEALELRTRDCPVCDFARW